MSVTTNLTHDDLVPAMKRAMMRHAAIDPNAVATLRNAASRLEDEADRIEFIVQGRSGHTMREITRHESEQQRADDTRTLASEIREIAFRLEAAL
jgi:hypothetical protein